MFNIVYSAAIDSRPPASTRKSVVKRDQLRRSQMIKKIRQQNEDPGYVEVLHYLVGKIFEL